MTKKISILLFSLFFAVDILAQESPVQGDDLLKCLGQPRSNPLVNQLNEFIGNRDAKSDISFLNYGRGVQVNFEKNILKGIDLYNEKNPYSEEFQKFQGKLPLDIGFDNTIHQVKQKIGEGFESTGEAINNYQLIKTFKLNDDDDYRMTVEFATGRMIMMSLAYIEGGEGKKDESKQKKNKGGFRGNDFFTMMRKNPYNLEFTRFRELLGYASSESRQRKLFVDQGVDVRLSSAGTIESVTLYSGGQQSDHKGMKFAPYTFDLPYNLRMENTRDGIKKKLGTPAIESGSSIIYNERNAVIEISFSGERIDYVRISAPKAEEK